MKINVGVIFGGISVEHEVSIISGLQAYNNINKDKYNPVPIYMSKEGDFYIGKLIRDIKNYKDIDKLLKKSNKIIMTKENDRVLLKKHGFSRNVYIDVILPVVHGTNVEDGNLQGYLKTLNIPYAMSDVLSSSVGMDKYMFKSVLKNESIPVLDATRLYKHEYINNPELLIENIINERKFPLIVKPINLGSSIGINIANTKEELDQFIIEAFTYSNKILVEDVVENLMEINISILGDIENQEPSLLEEPVRDEGILTFDEKYIKSSKGSSKGMASLSRKIPAVIEKGLEEKITKYAVKTFKALECTGLVRIDFLINKKTKEVFVNEINTIPGSLSFYLWEPKGVKYSELLDRLILLAIKKHNQDKLLTFKFESNILEGYKDGQKSGKFK